MRSIIAIFVVMVAQLEAPALALLGECQSTGCFTEGVLYDAFLLKTLAKDSPEECQVTCQNYPNCFFWSYLHDDGKCKMFPENTILGPDGDATGLTVTSGPVVCGCYQVGIRFDVESDVRFRFYGEVCSIFECEVLCQNTPNCHYYSYRADGQFNGSCIMYNSTGLVSHPRPYHISAPRSCEGCYQTGLEYETVAKTFLATIEDVYSPNLCQLQCANTTDCAYFNYYPEDCECVLARYGCTRVPSNFAISGPRTCDTCPCLDPAILLP